MQRITKFVQSLGPGILFASTCIGVSHLVQSTRAGADYGFGLLLFIVLANLLKYPFFEFGSRYAAATGQSILAGYKKQGRWVLVVYLLLSLVSMFTVTAAVTFVTAGLLAKMLGINLSTEWVSAIIFVVCIVILVIGKYKLLENILKVVASALLISTLIAFVAALANGFSAPAEARVAPALTDKTSLIFIVALMGWMPTAVDLSAWNSIWAVEKYSKQGTKPNLKTTLVDFNLGYIVTAVLSLCFLTLGAMVLFGTNEELSNQSGAFAGQVISLYTKTIGPWCYPVIAVAAFSTMFSTTITVLDGYSRSMDETISLLLPNKKTGPAAAQPNTRRRFYVPVMLVTALGSFVVIYQFIGSLKALVDLATILSFVIAPVIAAINFKVIRSKEVGKEYRPPRWVSATAVAGLVFLTVFTGLYLYVYFIMP